jgi:hypothetical protein
VGSGAPKADHLCGIAPRKTGSFTWDRTLLGRIFLVGSTGGFLSQLRGTEHYFTGYQQGLVALKPVDVTQLALFKYSSIHDGSN